MSDKCRGGGDNWGCLIFAVLLIWFVAQGCELAPRLERIEQKVDAIEKAVK